MRLNGLLVAFTLFFSAYRAVAQIPGMLPDKPWTLNGYLKYISVVNFSEQQNTTSDHLIEQRLNYQYRFNRHWQINGALRNRLLAGDSIDQSEYRQGLGDDPGYLQLTGNSVTNEQLVVNNQLDRLYLDWTNNDWQFRAGRFRINWGINTLWNPNDIFNSYSIYDFNYPQRGGSDALLIQRRLDFASAIELVYSPSQDSELHSYAGRYRFNRQGWDMQVLTGKADLDYLLAGGIAGDIYGAGLRGEFTWLHASRGQWQGQQIDDSLLLSVESDYRFNATANWIARIAVLYISAPQDDTTALQFLNLPLTARTLSFARFTGYADLSFDLTALSRATLSASYYGDGSIFVGLSNSYSLSDNCQLLSLLQGFTGRSASLFGQSRNLLASVQLKWSF